jgi:thiol-disulfide isomerase/thioredoxin
VAADIDALSIPMRESDFIAMRRSLISIAIIVCGFVLLPPLLHKLFPPQLPVAVLRVHERPHRLANFAFSDESGRSLTLDRFRGTFILVNVWATWCPPCKEEMPSLNHLAQIYANKDLTILPISIDVSRVSEVRQFYQRFGLNKLSIYVDPSKKVMLALAVTGIPTTLLINRDGLEIGRMVGAAQWDTPESVKRISEIVGQ